MDKVLSFLERNVQWIALGIGALFLAYMAYSNVVETPEHLTVDVGGRKVPPGELATAIGQSDAFVRLQEGMKREQKIKYPEVKPVEHLLEVVNRGPEGPPPPLGRTAPPPPPDGTTQPTKVAVNSLPKPPPPIVKGVSTGRSVVLPPPPEVGPDGQPLGDAAGVPPIGVPPVAAVPDAGQPPVRVGEDKDWVTVAFQIDMKALDKEFERAGVPKLQMPGVPGAPGAVNFAAMPANMRDEYVTQFLRVWLIREEQNSGGQWDPTTATVIPLQKRLEAMPLPENGTTPQHWQAGFEYARWAAANLGFMFQPAFPEVVAGDPWYYPGQPKPQPMPGTQRPAYTPPPGYIPPSPTPGIPTRFGMPPGAGGYGGAPAPPPAGGYGGPGYPPPGYAQPGYPQPGYAPPYGGDYYNPSGSGVPGVVTATGVPGSGSPDGKFNVAQAAQAMPVFEFWAHDLTAQPAKTYRYRGRYAILSPVFQRRDLAPVNLASQFALVSEPGPWSEQVDVQPRVEFYVKGYAAGGAKAQLDLFTWKEGGWGVKQVEVAPGDPIGDSKYVVVDVRQEGARGNNRYYVLVADASGQLSRRSARDDTASDRYKQLQLEAMGPVVPGAPGTPGAPGYGQPGDPGAPLPPPLRPGI